MDKRTQFIVDRKFQLKQAFSTIRITFLAVAIFVGITVGTIVYNNYKLGIMSKNNEDIIVKLENINIIQDNIVETILTWTQEPGGKTQKKAISEVSRKHQGNIQMIQENITTIQSNITANNRIIDNNNIMLILVVVLLILAVPLLYFLMIRKTHHISGPIHVISEYLREIIEGKIPTVRPIRKNDELQEFYTLFAEMVEHLREKEGR